MHHKVCDYIRQLLWHLSRYRVPYAAKDME